MALVKTLGETFKREMPADLLAAVRADAQADADAEAEEEEGLAGAVDDEE